MEAGNEFQQNGADNVKEQVEWMLLRWGSRNVFDDLVIMLLVMDGL